LARGLLEVKEIFGDDLRENEVFTTQVTAHLASLFAQGAQATVRGVR